MSGATTAILVGTAVAGTAYSVYSGEKAQDAQKDAMKKAEAANAATQVKADQAMNSVNQKKPNVAGLLESAQNKSGLTSTMLTGTQGIDPSALTLSKNTLLGA